MDDRRVHTVRPVILLKCNKPLANSYRRPMSICPFQPLELFSSHPDVSVQVSGEARVFEARRGGLIVRVTVPDDVLEWFVDVVDGTDVVVQDWMDYEGCDDSPREELAQSMASDIDDFPVKLLQRDIRLAPGKQTLVEGFLAKLLNRDIRVFRAKPILEWKTNGSWEQALPFYSTEA